MIIYHAHREGDVIRVTDNPSKTDSIAIPRYFTLNLGSELALFLSPSSLIELRNKLHAAIQADPELLDDIDTLTRAVEGVDPVAVAEFEAGRMLQIHWTGRAHIDQQIVEHPELQHWAETPAK